MRLLSSRPVMAAGSCISRGSHASTSYAPVSPAAIAPRSCSQARPRRGAAAAVRSVQRLRVVASTQPETEEARSPLDAPQEWEAPQPSRRPDIFPEFEKLQKVFLPKSLPGDPEQPDEELDEAAKRTMPGDPDSEQKPGEPPELPQQPREPGSDPERTDIPNSPE